LAEGWLTTEDSQIERIATDRRAIETRWPKSEDSYRKRMAEDEGQPQREDDRRERRANV